MTAHRPILLLNASYAPLGVVSWMRAVCLLFTAKAETVAEQERVVASPSVRLRLPSVLRLVGKVKHRARKVRLSRRNLFLRDGHVCQYCGRVLPAAHLTMDHVVPRAAGGPTRWENLVTACIDDNQRKGGRTPDEAGLRLLRSPQVPGWSPAEQIVMLHGPEVPEDWRIFLPQPRNRR